MRVPSGDHCGSLSFQSLPSVICFPLPDFTSTTHRCVRRSSNQPVSLNLYDEFLYWPPSLRSLLSARLSLGPTRLTTTSRLPSADPRQVPTRSLRFAMR